MVKCQSTTLAKNMAMRVVFMKSITNKLFLIRFYKINQLWILFIYLFMKLFISCSTINLRIIWIKTRIFVLISFYGIYEIKITRYKQYWVLKHLFHFSIHSAISMGTPYTIKKFLRTHHYRRTMNLPVRFNYFFSIYLTVREPVKNSAGF